MRIRPYRPEDIEPVYTLFYNTVHEIGQRDYTPEQLAAWGKRQRNVQRWDVCLPNQLTLVAENDAEIIGFSSLRTANSYLDFMFVHHQYQNQGVAKALLQHIEQEARNLGLTRLVTDSSLTARAFFKGQGYELVEENIKEVDGIQFRNARMAKEIL